MQYNNQVNSNSQVTQNSAYGNTNECIIVTTEIPNGQFVGGNEIAKLIYLSKQHSICLIRDTLLELVPDKGNYFRVAVTEYYTVLNE